MNATLSLPCASWSQGVLTLTDTKGKATYIAHHDHRTDTIDGVFLLNLEGELSEGIKQKAESYIGRRSGAWQSNAS
jgi:hypothetical protein